MLKWLKIFALVIFIPLSSLAAEQAETFVISVYDSYIKVVSPPKHRSSLSIIIENKMLSKMIAKVVNSKGDQIDVMTIPPTGFHSVNLKIKKNERLYFVPMTPAFQEVELIFGKKSYEIPPKI